MIEKQEERTRRLRLQRSVLCIQREVDHLSQKSRFVKDNQAQFDLPVLQRGELTVSRLLGYGSFSEVHEISRIQLPVVADPIQQEARELFERESTHEDGPCRHVIKHLRSDLQLGQSDFHRAAGDLVMEATFLANLDHPNIIKIRAWSGGAGSYCAGSIDSFFLVLDRLDGTLMQRIAEWQCMRRKQNDMYPLNLHEYHDQLDCVHQLAKALDYLHSRRIVYRDLKPENIGFQGDKVILFDFGLCRELPEEGDKSVKGTYEMSGVGTRRYMAPEVFCGGRYNEKVDVYSWSLILYTVIALQKPFEKYSSSMHEELVCKKGVRPYVYPNLPDVIKSLMVSCWAPKHKKRPTMGAVCDTLDRVLHGKRIHHRLQQQQQQQQPQKLVLIETEGSSPEQSQASTSNSAWGMPVELFKTFTNVASQATSFIRLWEEQVMVESVPALAKTRSIDRPDLQHLRSAYL